MSNTNTYPLHLDFLFLQHHRSACSTWASTSRVAVRRPCPALCQLQLLNDQGMFVIRGETYDAYGEERRAVRIHPMRGKVSDDSLGTDKGKDAVLYGQRETVD